MTAEAVTAERFAEAQELKMREREATSPVEKKGRKDMTYIDIWLGLDFL